MKVLHLDEQRGWRGGEQQVFYLVRGLQSHGVDCVVAGHRDGALLERLRPFVNSFPLSWRGELDLNAAWRIAGIIREDVIDIIHAHTSHAHSTALIARTIARRGKVVVSRRVDFPIGRNAFSRIKYQKPDHFIAISQRIAEVLREGGVPASKISVVRSGIEPVRFESAVSVRAELGIAESTPVIGNIAALVGHKDHATLVAAMPLVLREIPAATLLIAGEGPLRAAIEDLIQRLALQHAVRLLGFYENTPGLLRALDVFVLSSKEEGLGTSILDAMAAGVPVVATRAGGIPEMVGHEKSGLLASPQSPTGLAAALIRILNDRAFARMLADNARQRVRVEFTAQAMVDGNVAIYEQVLGQ